MFNCCSRSWEYRVVFFFQAEDGIRDVAVTGVQTCALPISSNAYDNTIGVVDLKQMKVVKKLKTEAKPDGSAYASPFHKLYVSDERGKAEAVVDVQKDEIIRTLHFGNV